MKLTDKELGLLIHLIRRDARLIGYGAIYYEDNKKRWPSRLKRMQTIVKKLIAERERINESGISQSRDESSSLYRLH